MKRVLLDTNIYGRIVERSEEEEMKAQLEKRLDIIIYGFDVVRKELRALSKEVRHEKGQVRLILLGLYDRLIRSHIYELDIVVSDDNKTMLSDKAIDAYRVVNILRKYRTPDFIGYEGFKRLFS